MLEPTTTATLATKEAKSHPKGRRDRVRRAYNLHLVDGFGVDEQTGMPMLDPVQIVPERLRAFTSCARATDLKAGVHFFLDDYRFEATWSDPERYASMLSRFACVLTPDFSCYLDMPEPMQRWNVYRGRAVGLSLIHILRARSGFSAMMEAMTSADTVFATCRFSCPSNVS